MTDKERFDELWRAHYGAVLGYARRRAPADVAQDVVADTFLVAWRRLDELPPERARRAWLLGIARRTLASRRRGERRREALAALAAPIQEHPCRRRDHPPEGRRPVHRPRRPAPASARAHRRDPARARVPSPRAAARVPQAVRGRRRPRGRRDGARRALGGSGSPLEQAAQAARNEPPPPANYDGFRYVRTEEISVNRVTDGPDRKVESRGTIVRERWIDKNGAGRDRQDRGERVVTGDRDLARHLLPNGPPGVVDRDVEDFRGDGPLADVRLADLPTEPEGLLREIERRIAARGGSGDRRHVVFRQTLVLLSSERAEPALRSALYALLAHLDGVELLGERTDRAGRTGEGIRVTLGPFATTAIFDPRTSQVLEITDTEAQGLRPEIPEPGSPAPPPLPFGSDGVVTGVASRTTTYFGPRIVASVNER